MPFVQKSDCSWIVYYGASLMVYSQVKNWNLQRQVVLLSIESKMSFGDEVPFNMQCLIHDTSRWAYLRYLSALSVIAVQETMFNWLSFLLYLLRLCAVLSVIRLQSSKFSTSIFLQLSANVLEGQGENRERITGKHSVLYFFVQPQDCGTNYHYISGNLRH